MGFGEAISTCFNKYADFSGRATRPEYWFFVLLAVIVATLAATVHPAVGLLQLGLIVPHLAVACRRLHDVGKSGWLQLIALIPIIGVLVLIYFLAQPGDRSANVYGPSPAGA